MQIKQILRYQLVYILLAVLLVVAVILNINTGNIHISPARIFRIIFLRVIWEHLNTILSGKYDFHDYVWRLFWAVLCHCQDFCYRHFSEIQ